MPENPLLYLVRHGETDANVANRYAGWSDDRLNERGRGQAAALARRLEPEGVRNVFSSPVRRAAETAGILADALSATVRTVHGLHEIAVGPWKGLTVEEVRARWPAEHEAFMERPDTFRLEGRERLDAVRTRALDGMDRVAHSLLSAADRPALLITHLAVLRVLWLEAEGRPLSEYHRVRGPFCEPFPLRWRGSGRLETAGPAPAGA